jgi:hypothetical protein
MFVEWKIKTLNTSLISTNYCPVFVAQYQAGIGGGGMALFKVSKNRKFSRNRKAILQASF